MPENIHSDDELPIDGRAEAALNAAFQQQADQLSPQAIDISEVRRHANRRTALRLGGVAAAVLLISGGVTAAVQLQRERSVSPTAASGSQGDTAAESEAPPSASEAPTPSEAATVAPTSSETAAPPEAPAGWRTEYYRDIEVKVPPSWGYGSEPASDWCVNPKSLPDAPYVSRHFPDQVVLTINCPSPDDKPGFSNEAQVRYWVEHLALEPVSLHRAGPEPASTERVDDWWVIRQRVGEALVKVVSRDKALAETIIGSARMVQPSKQRCAPQSEIEGSPYPSPREPFDVSQIESVDSISVCLYSRGESATPGLIALKELDAEAANEVLSAIQASPVGGGPDSPEDCASWIYGDTAIVARLRVGDATHDLYVYYGSCRGNGFDDGTVKRELTVEACTPLIQAPVAIWSGSHESFQRCNPR